MIIRKTASRDDFEAVWRLTHDVSVAAGDASAQPNGMLRNYPHLDASPDTTVLMAENDAGELLGSSSFTCDGPAGLPVEDFKEVVDQLRLDSRCRLGVSWRLVTRPGRKDEADILKALINDTLLLSKGLTDVALFTTNPKHEEFYRKLLGLERIAGSRGSRSILMMGRLPVEAGRA